MTIEELYNERNCPEVAHNDIWEHMPLMRRYAEKVLTICEIGTRTGNSTTAFLAGLSKRGGVMHSYDIGFQQFAPPPIENVSWHYHQADSQATDFKVEPCDLLFIDGNHAYSFVSNDLKQAAQASRFIILHDTSEERDRAYRDGVCQAMREFLKANQDWEVVERHINCNGITVLEKRT